MIRGPVREVTGYRYDHLGWIGSGVCAGCGNLLDYAALVEEVELLPRGRLRELTVRHLVLCYPCAWTVAGRSVAPLARFIAVAAT